MTFRAAILGGEIGSDDPEITNIGWRTIADAERLLPDYRDLRGLYARTAHYQVQPSYE